ncbi:hypothetical protein [Nocardioides sp. LS1]|uniref:hypothetical protein n=1 Tax=Nocardioides sp. LS1 TaxID=1027620 RepID=UPI000F62169E|nr:hypothetical protein [Nocardioides sp. LS1]GCD89718.1 hypothetical protein NLS1_17240 [Nocardioides sp. LS1]
MRLLTRAALAAGLLTMNGLAVACSEDNPLDNASTCPGSTCTAELQDLVDAVGAVDGVHAVTEAHREHVVGKPERVLVEVDAAPTDDAAGESIANDVADVIEASPIAPEQLAVTVTWRPADMVDHPVEFTSHQAPPGGRCADSGCSSELAALVADVRARYPDASGVRATLEGGRVDVSGRWEGAGDAPAVAVAGLVHDSEVRGYDTTVVTLVERTPHQVEVRRGGW